MIHKQTYRGVCLLLPTVILSSFLVTGAGVPVQGKPDIIFTGVPAAAEPAAAPAITGLPSDRYVEGCRIFRFSFAGARAQAVPLTAEFLSACDPAVSFDGQKVLFAGKQKKDEPWQIRQMDGNGENKIQITHGDSDCVSPLYLGSLFHLDDQAPTRKIAYVQENHLYTCDLDGKNPQQVTFNVYPEFSPDVLPNGRIIYSSLKSNGFESGSAEALDLLAVNIDGTDLMGYVTGFDVPGNKEMVRVSGDGHVYFVQSDVSQWLGGGALACVSARRPAHSYHMIAPDEKGFYRSPCPLPDGSLVVSYRSRKKGSLYGLYLLTLDATGEDVEIIKSFCGGSRGAVFSKRAPLAGGYHCIDAQVLAAHPVVKGRSSFVDHNQETGVFYCIDVYISDRPEMKRLARGSVKQVRVREAAAADRILGTAPVEEDGSFHIRVPAKTPLAFELLDKQGKTITRQLTRTWVMPRESRGCIGCHENRELAPPNRFARALAKPAVPIGAAPEKR